MSNDTLLALVSTVFTNGRQIAQFDQQVGGVLTIYRLAGLLVYQTQSDETGEYKYVVFSSKRCLGVAYC